MGTLYALGSYTTYDGQIVIIRFADGTTTIIILALILVHAYKSVLYSGANLMKQNLNPCEHESDTSIQAGPVHLFRAKHTSGADSGKEASEESSMLN